MKSFSSLRPVAIMLLLSVALWALAATAANAASDASAKVEAAVRHAETYYQLGSTGQGDLSALQSGERSLASAEKQLRDMPE